jgi:putative transposase
VDETYVKVAGQWKYLYRAVDKLGQTVDFLLTARRDVAAARRFFERAIDQHDVPEKDHDRQERCEHGRRAGPDR